MGFFTELDEFVDSTGSQNLLPNQDVNIFSPIY